MNVLIFDSSLVPDIGYQQRIVKLLGRIADTSVRFATGILQATWQTCHFRPDVIVFDWICNRKQIRKLIAMLLRINPAVGIFHLDGDGFSVAERSCDALAESAVPHWLHDIAAEWILARHIPMLITSSN